MAKNSELVGVQYLRGFCAAAVVLDHASGMAGLPKYFGQSLFDGALVHGRIGVDIFFVISGFIITIVALQDGGTRPKIAIGPFCRKRFARIVPLMWLAIASYAVLRGLFAGGDFVDPAFLRAAFLLPFGTVEPNVIWTLRHELIFYALFAVSFLGPRPMRFVLYAWFLAPLVYALLTGTIGAQSDELTMLGVVCSSVNVEFAAGFFAGIVWLRWPARTTLSTPIPASLMLLALTVALIAVGAFMPTPWLSLPTSLILGIGGAALISYAARLKGDAGLVGRSALLLGNASYAIYLFHLHILSAGLAIWAKLAHGTPVGLVVIGLCLLSIAGGCVVHLWVERPLIQWAQRWFGPKVAERGMAGMPSSS